MKEARLNIRIDAETLEKFQEYCRKIGTTASDEIRRQIHRLINEAK